MEMNLNNISQKEKIDADILQFLKNCYSNYLKDIREEIRIFPQDYIFPDGNPILPVLPTNLVKNSIMLIGAFPSARFERRNEKLIPVANNLSPFANEEYFDGREIRKQASREFLDDHYFPQLNINPNEMWITDLVKIYLFPQKHINNCNVFSQNKFVNTHEMFKEIAGSKANMKWMLNEIKLCNPKLIITLGEIPARIIRNENKLKNKELLNGEITNINIEEKNYLIASLAHPEIRRRNKEWNDYTNEAIKKLSIQINKIV